MNTDDLRPLAAALFGRPPGGGEPPSRVLLSQSPPAEPERTPYPWERPDTGQASPDGITPLDNETDGARHVDNPDLNWFSAVLADDPALATSGPYTTGVGRDDVSNWPGG